MKATFSMFFFLHEQHIHTWFYKLKTTVEITNGWFK